MEPKQHLQEAAQQQAQQSIRPDVYREMNEEDRTARGLGVAIGQWADWDGSRVLDVFYSALEECNYRDEAAQVKRMIDQLDAQDDQED